MKNLRKNGGFTLIEILVVIGIIAILAVIVLIAINPARQFKQARDAQRTSNVNAILNAVGQFTADNKGDLPAGITNTLSDIPVALCSDLIPTYLPALPTDPSSYFNGGDIEDCTDLVDPNWSDYKVVKNATTSRITVSAVGEITPIIDVTR